jgi:hypothetical protein
MVRMEKFNIIIIIAIVSLVAVLLIYSYVGMVGTALVVADPTQYEKDDVIYQFNENISSAWSFGPVYSESQIVDEMQNTGAVVIVFNGSSNDNNGRLAVLSFNVVSKLQNYYTHTQGRIVKFGSIDLNNPDENITHLSNQYTYVYISGPESGSNETMISYGPSRYVNNITSTNAWIYVKSSDYINMTRAVDKLILLTIGYNEAV